MTPAGSIANQEATSSLEGGSSASVPPRAGILGTGLIGGSLGLALRARGWHVSGYDVDPAKGQRALELGALDAVGRDPIAQITFVCTPAASVVAEARAALASGARLVTDVAGVKAAIVAGVNNPLFIGGHPMAGSELEGVDGADAGLFSGATWVLTPITATDADAYRCLCSVLNSLGANVLALSADRHDDLVARVSHVPHLVAAALVNQATSAAGQEAAVLRLAAGGFRDMTRVAAGHPGIWPDICAQNAPAIADVLGDLVTRLVDMRQIVLEGDNDRLLFTLASARAARSQLPVPIARPDELIEVRVAVPDRPGVVAGVAALLSELQINIENLEIVHSAEGGGGVLVLLVHRGAADRVRLALRAWGRNYPASTQDTGSALLVDKIADAQLGPSLFRITGGGRLRARLQVPGDKSISHRALILGALSEGSSEISGLSSGEDVARTAAAIAALGAGVEITDGSMVVRGGRDRLIESDQVIDVGNSGTTLRLLAGVCAGLANTVTVFTGDESIRRRPMGRVAAPLRLMGAALTGRDGGRLPPLVVQGAELAGIDYALPVPSAQVKAAVLLAGLRAKGITRIREAVISRAHTEEMLAERGAQITVRDNGSGRLIELEPSRLSPLDLRVPGDPSSAAFWLVAACIVPNSDITIVDVYQGRARSGFIEVLQRMGADISRLADGALRARYGPLGPTRIAGAEIPGLIDEIPVLAVAACFARGTTVVADAAELRVKESDRIVTMTTGLRAMGAVVEITDDGMIIEGGNALHGATVHSHGDHRVAMALAVAALAASGNTEIGGWDAVATSYPSFEAHLAECLG